MARNDRSPFEFNTTMNDDKKTDVSTKSDWHMPQISFADLQLGAPILLIFTWFIVLMIELMFGGFSQTSLDKWPVAMGNISHINFLMRPLTHWLNSFDGQHVVAGFVLGLFAKMVSWVVIVVCSATTGFFHVGFPHFFGNLCTFVMVLFGLECIGIRGRQITRLWFGLSCAGIGTVWTLFEFLSSVSNITQVPANVLSLIALSDVPVMGASVGIFGLFGFMIFRLLRQLKFSFVRGCLFIFYVGFSIALLYGTWNGLGDYNLLTQAGSANLLATFMHLTGFFFGSLRGLKLHKHV